LLFPLRSLVSSVGNGSLKSGKEGGILPMTIVNRVPDQPFPSCTCVSLGSSRVVGGDPVQLYEEMKHLSHLLLLVWRLRNAIPRLTYSAGWRM
jgi:hypothetical protein